MCPFLSDYQLPSLPSPQCLQKGGTSHLPFSDNLFLAKLDAELYLGIWACGLGLDCGASPSPAAPLPSLWGPGPGEFSLCPLPAPPAPPLARQSWDGNFTVLLLLHCCPHWAPQPLRAQARPFQRNGFLHLYNVRGKKGPLDLWKLYKVYGVLAGPK